MRMAGVLAGLPQDVEAECLDVLGDTTSMPPVDMGLFSMNPTSYASSINAISVILQVNVSRLHKALDAL